MQQRLPSVRWDAKAFNQLLHGRGLNKSALLALLSALLRLVKEGQRTTAGLSTILYTQACQAGAHRVLEHGHGQCRSAQVGAQLRLIFQPLRRPPQVPACSPWSLPLHALFQMGCLLCHGRRLFPT